MAITKTHVSGKIGPHTKDTQRLEFFINGILEGSWREGDCVWIGWEEITSFMIRARLQLDKGDALDALRDRYHQAGWQVELDGRDELGWPEFLIFS